MIIKFRKKNLLINKLLFRINKIKFRLFRGNVRKMGLKLERDRLLVRKHRVGPRFTGAASGDRAYSIFEKRMQLLECQTLWKVVGGTAVHLAVRTRCRHSFPAPPDSWVHFSRSNTPFSPTCIKWSIKTGQQVGVENGALQPRKRFECSTFRQTVPYRFQRHRNLNNKNVFFR